MLAERKQLAPTPPCSGPEQVLLSSWAAPEEKICRQAGRRQPIGNRSGWLTLSRIVVIILVAATASAIFPLPQVTPFSRNTNSSLPSESQVNIQHSLVTPHTPLANLPGVQKTLLLSSDSLLSGNYINSGTACAFTNWPHGERIGSPLYQFCDPSFGSRNRGLRGSLPHP